MTWFILIRLGQQLDGPSLSDLCSSAFICGSNFLKVVAHPSGHETLVGRRSDSAARCPCELPIHSDSPLHDHKIMGSLPISTLPQVSR